MTIIIQRWFNGKKIAGKFLAFKIYGLLRIFTSSLPEAKTVTTLQVKKNVIQKISPL